MSNTFHFDNDIDVDRLAKYVRIDLERTGELNTKIPCPACGLIDHLGQGPAFPETVWECQQSDMTCRKMGGECGSYNFVWWFLHLAEMASKPIKEVAPIKGEIYEEFEGEPKEDVND